jgi:hypothetical protein
MTSRRIIRWSIQAVRQGGLPAIGVFAFHVVATRGFHAYEHFPSLDIPMHFLGGVAIAYFFHRASIAASEWGVIGPFHRVTHAVLVVSLTCTATVLWEFAEFIADRFGAHSQLGLEDTLGDMLMGICGGIVLLGAVEWAWRRPQTTSGHNGQPDP